MNRSDAAPVTMKAYRNTSIKRKLLAVIVATTAIALCFAGAAMVLLDSTLFHISMQRDLASLASIAGDNSTAALAFDDPNVATETLTSLRARPHLVSACLYRPDGSLFAIYARPGAARSCPPPRVQQTIEGAPGGIAVSHPVMLRGKRVGTLVLLYDRGEMWQRLAVYAAIVFVILLAASAFAIAASSRLRNAITAPISHLSRAAAAVSERADYSVRVPKETGDELGVLVDAFNQMLERVQMRDVELQDARNSLETTLTSIGDAVVATDENGCVSFANPVAKSLLRWTETDLIGKHIDEVFHMEREYPRERLENPVHRVLREGRTVGLANRTILVVRDGTEIPIDDTAAPIRQGGRIAGAVLVFRDITERRRAQQDAAYLAAIVESSNDAIVGRSPEGVIQTWNAGAEKLYGYSANEAIGLQVETLIPYENRPREEEMMERVRTGGAVVHFESRRIRKDAAVVDVSLTVSPIRDKAGQLIGMSYISRDITEQKKSAESMRQTQKLESLGVLAGGIAHDFNNLLTGILGNASLALEDTPPGSVARQSMESVIAAGDRAAQLAQQMLAYSGKGRFVVERMNMSAKIREIVPLIKAAIRPNIELRLALADDLPPIDADAAQMQQLIMNVIINGAEAVPEGSPGALTIATRRQEIGSRYAHNGSGELKPGPHVVFEVTDTGCGMDEATKSRIFDPFFTTKFTGRGLGLSAVVGIVRGHRGAVEVSSALGKGTTFRFLFPVAGGNASAKQKGAQEGDASDLRGAGLVLVVDDEEIVRNMAKRALERYGYAVVVAEDGAAGVDLYCHEQDRIRCVVLDLTMPVMGGEEALSRMKAVRADIPILLSSGFNEAQAVERFQGKGLAGFLQKPYRTSTLLEKVKSVARQDVKALK